MNTNDTEKMYEPIGREKELAKFQSILVEKKPALIRITGEQGMGKSTFLRMTKKMAKEQQWNVITMKDSEGPAIDADITREDFEQKMKEQLEKFEVKAENAGVSSQKIAEKILGITDTQSTRKQEFDVITKEYIKDPAIDADTTRKDSEQKRNRKRESENVSLIPVVNQLKHKSPVVLQIDGYEPGTQFASWFTSEFIPGFKESKASIIVVVADRLSAIDSLAELADYKIQIKGINRSVIKKHLRRLNNFLKSTLNPEEFQIYVDEITERPSLLEPLTRTLLSQMPK